MIWVITAIVAMVVIAGVLIALFGNSPPKIPPSRSAPLRVWLDSGSYVEGVNLVMRITTEQKTKVTVAPKTDAGHDAPIDGAVVFTSDNEAVATIEVIDGTSAYVIGVAPGAALIGASFDADLGEGVRTISATGALEVAAAEATSAEIVFGDAENQ